MLAININRNSFFQQIVKNLLSYSMDQMRFFIFKFRILSFLSYNLSLILF